MYIKLDLTRSQEYGNKPIKELDSLALLKKPQKGKYFKSSFAVQNELQRNTILNRKSNDDLFSINTTTNNTNNINNNDDNTNNANTNIYELTRQFSAISPRSSLTEEKIDEMFNNEKKNAVDSLNPIYKKSGELVKSSLKKRSMSLPNTTYHKVISETTKLNSIRTRSKSVHFNVHAPVKYFLKDESPIDLSLSEVKMDKLSYTPKQLTRSNSPEKDHIEYEEEPSFLFDKLSIVDKPPKKTNNNSHNNDSRIRGLYNVNFPILSNKNPKSLKLNIFINLSQQKKCFLQDLTLHIQKNALVPSGYQAHTSFLYSFIVGRVLVKNIHFDKRVIVKYTFNHWKTSHDTQCMYISDAQAILPGTNMDIFKFIIDYNDIKSNKGDLEFCIQYVTRNDEEVIEFWDNNDGKNYKVDIIMNGFTNPFI
ncbi:hypothetical protein Kpol_1009p19 [Vanderwaltozyma polyspora DSM 70294]|uniref:CBM21 domain-containing protein n=1 Tax=Vanderwaltozyma polyspora (strain ATCC 22028 / DSM 70294 / BCRC 21397 / CBS 2163 / NBRC 10782 / NRRL Y-8283 / UCD 57-17) TaxID=436907 RepID=A7TPE4_VANPO|nr:uncharacterized protein Kpol_1009p19 [Vanderwaltozyma polyspora DSM 70294]EDO15872.1 hypothetical protein Kpol_1009p19 [Vanderwaltozyma polyspora DSM 70294]